MRFIIDSDLVFGRCRRDVVAVVTGMTVRRVLVAEAVEIGLKKSRSE
jgi:hypothetical protein